ncbi:cytochrome P450 monooxygenase sdnE [Colletotrichum liriopes]|uniref:Cytochrome P450 monooxygenase sdnE n=1 Tax=Colletotrichum liriopes TaxID=708192 RepID=A0AA37GPV8_9PEZI|nr:cytochrome P450 monooxygenase sdnE [Colletotrichum liriopes]
MLTVDFLFSQSTFGIALLAACLYTLSLAVYRLFLSPLRKFPGPKLAAATLWYEFYYDVVLGGQYSFHIAKLHEEYGPVIRINPHEIHVQTPEFYDILYSGGKRRRNKWSWASGAFGVDLSTFGSELHEAHRLRRSAIAPFFSKARVRKLEPMIQERANAVLGRLKGFAATGEVMRLDHALTAYATDIITNYAFGLCHDRVNAPDFDAGFHSACLSGCQQVFLSRQFPFLMDIVKMIPGSWILKWSPAINSYFSMQMDIGKLIVKICRQNRSEWPELEHPTFFHELLDSKLPESEKSIARLAQEGGSLLGAGTVTTSWTITTGVFYLLREPDVLQKLKFELAKAIPPDSAIDNENGLLSALEGLPYLNAVAQEMVRMGHGLVSRAARIAPDEDLVVPGTEFVIPRNTPISMTHLLLNRDPGLYESPNRFLPERWIGNPVLPRQFGFSNGARACSGRDLAMTEIYLIIGTIFRTYGTKEIRFPGDVGFIELWETDETDVECSVDAMVARPKSDSKGVRCKVKHW